jgi:hypothetical protein
MATFTWPNVYDALYDACKAAMPSCTVMWEFATSNNGAQFPMPAKPFVALNLTTRDIAPGLQGSDEVQNTTTPGTVAYSHHRRHTLSVNVYSNTAFGAGHACALLAQLTRELRTDGRILALRQAGCKAWVDGPVRDLTALLDTRAESRAQCDVTVATLDSSTEVSGWIETVDIAGIKVDGVPI